MFHVYVHVKFYSVSMIETSETVSSSTFSFRFSGDDSFLILLLKSIFDKSYYVFFDEWNPFMSP